MSRKTKPSSPPPKEERRTFLQTSVVTATATGCGLCALGAGKTLLPPTSASDTTTIPFDTKQLKAGEHTSLMWQSRPIFIYRRTEEDLTTLQNTVHLRLLRDPDSLAAQQPDSCKNWHRSLTPQIGVYVGICTHFGCIPVFTKKTDIKAQNGTNGYYCPCHGSYYDVAGRVTKGSAAPLNLPVPPHLIEAGGMITIGKNPPGVSYDLSSIEQL